MDGPPAGNPDGDDRYEGDPLGRYEGADTPERWYDGDPTGAGLAPPALTVGGRECEAPPTDGAYTDDRTGNEIRGLDDITLGATIGGR